MTAQQILTISAVIMAVAGALGVLYRYVACPFWKIARGAYQFFEGTPPKGDKKGRPGIMAWMDNVDRHLGNGTSPSLRELLIDTRTRVSTLEDRRQRDIPVKVERRGATPT